MTRNILLIPSLVLMFAVVASLTLLACPAYGTTSATTPRPDGSVTSGWTPTPAGAGTNHLRVDEATVNDLDYVQAQAATSDEYSTQNINANAQRASNIQLRVRMTRVSSENCTGLFAGTPQNMPLVIGIRLNGGALQTVNKTVTGSNGTYAWYTQDFAGSFTQATIDSLQTYIAKGNQPACAGLLGQTIQAVFRVSAVEAVITWQTPNLDQTVSRIYQNQNNTQPGTPLALTNVAADLQQGVPFRVRAGITATDFSWLSGSWGNHSNTYKLQYAQKTVALCSGQTTGWSDVQSGSGAIRWNDNASVADGATIATYAQDPTTTGVKIHQTYEESNGFTNTSTITTGNVGLWDFSLINTGSITPGTTFCFRIYKNDATALLTYTTYPEVVIVKDYGVDIIDGTGSVVAAPVVNFSTSTVATTQCVSSTATLGTPSQKLRINNDILKGGWNVSIAATNGPMTTWASGGSGYDFNDSGGTPQGCQDSGDVDAYGGQLRINPNVGSVAAKSGCTTTGLSWGVDAKFSQGLVDAITIGSADATSSRFCYWDVTGVALEQKIPAATPSGAYSIDMTVTMTAL